MEIKKKKYIANFFYKHYTKCGMKNQLGGLIMKGKNYGRKINPMRCYFKSIVIK